MIEPEDYIAEIEADRGWRMDEMRILGNMLMDIKTAEQQDRFRTVLAIMLYAHYEGHCKIALTVYAKYINELDLTCSEAIPALIASTLHREFSWYEIGGKSSLSGKFLPNDVTSKKEEKRRAFVMAYVEIMNQKILLDVDRIVDSENNLTPKVLNRILYRLGLDEEAFKAHDGLINRLLDIRNQKSHGDDTGGLNEKSYRELNDTVSSCMDQLHEMILSALKNRLYLSTSAQKSDLF